MKVWKNLGHIVLLISVAVLIGYGFWPRPYSYHVTTASQYITQHAYSSSHGICAGHVRLALEAGGCPTWGYPMTAGGYNEFLTHLDFSQVDRQKYRPQVGDIVVFNATQGHPCGHIAMWNGRQWVSDFLQRNFFVAQAYRVSDDYRYYRMLKEHPKRHFTLLHHLRGLIINPISKLAYKVLRTESGDDSSFHTFFKKISSAL